MCCSSEKKEEEEEEKRQVILSEACSETREDSLAGEQSLNCSSATADRRFALVARHKKKFPFCYSPEFDCKVLRVRKRERERNRKRERERVKAQTLLHLTFFSLWPCTSDVK